MGKIDENKRLKLNAMLDAALQLFTDQGINKTSISDIAARSGVAKGTFYLYFKDKYDIRNRLVVHHSQKLLGDAYEAMLASGVKTLEEQIVFIADHILDRLSQQKDLMVLISKNFSWSVLKRELNRTELEEDFPFRSCFLELTAPYHIPEADAELMLYLIVELVGSTCYSVILYEEPCDLQHFKPELFEALRAIIRRYTAAGKEPT